MLRRLPTPALGSWIPRSALPDWRYVLAVVAIAAATLVAYLYVVPNSEISASKVRIGELKAEVAALERENASLLSEIARYSDMNTLEARAKQLGMGPARGAVYLRLPAAGQPGVEPVATNANSPAADEAPLTPRGLLRQLDLSARAEQVRDGLISAVDGLVNRFSQAGDSEP